GRASRRLRSRLSANEERARSRVPRDAVNIATSTERNEATAMATRRGSGSQRKYGPAARKSVKSALHRAKGGTLKSGKGRHPKVKSRKQAIAIGLSEARKKGAKVPRRKKAA